MTVQADVLGFLNLIDALCDLNAASEEAREEGFPLPSVLALVNTTRLLRELYRIRPRRYLVYPTARLQ